MTAVRIPGGLRPLLSDAGDLLDGAQGYIVGGTPRDALLDRPITDLDLAVACDATAYARELADRLRSHFVPLDDERGTARILLDGGAVRTVDVAQLRGDIANDLSMRDFTIDAMAAELDPTAAELELIDPHGGVDDIAARTVRLVREQALDEDPLRMLRAVRLATVLEFEIEPTTAGAIRSRVGRIVEAAPERQRDELSYCFSTDRAAHALRTMDGLGLLDVIFPEVALGRGVEQPYEHHYWDVFNHSIEAVRALDVMLAEDAPSDERGASIWRELWSALEGLTEPRDYLREQVVEGRCRTALLKIAGLLHDVAKPETRAPDESGRIRFFGHADIGGQTARRVLRRLRFSRREIDLVATLVEEHLRPTQLGPADELPTRRALFRFFRDTGEAAEGTLLVALADALAARGPRMTIEAWRGYCNYIAYVLERRNEEKAIERAPRLLTGEDVMANLRIEPGREVGRLLSALEEARAAGEVSTREEALSYIERLHSESNGGSAMLAGVGGVA